MAAEPRIRVSAILRWQERVLLCRHEKGEKQYWLLPGGGVNSGESLVDALHRELGEELGIAENLPVEGPVAIVDSIAPIRSFAAKHVVLSGLLNLASPARFAGHDDLRGFRLHPEPPCAAAAHVGCGGAGCGYTFLVTTAPLTRTVG